LRDWLIFEEEVAARLRKAGIPAIRTPFSGKVMRGDVHAPGLLIECKFNENGYVARIPRSKLERTIRDAETENRMPTLAFKLKGTSQIYFVVRIEDFIELIKAHGLMEELKRRVALLLNEHFVREKMLRFRCVSNENASDSQRFLHIAVLIFLWPLPPFFVKLPEQAGLNQTS